MQSNKENVHDKKFEKHDDNPKNRPNKIDPNRYLTIFPNTIDNLGKHLIGNLLSIEMINNKTITGKLKSFGQYDIMITDSTTGQDIIIMKTGILTIRGDLSIKDKSKL